MLVALTMVPPGSFPQLAKFLGQAEGLALSYCNAALAEECRAECERRREKWRIQDRKSRKVLKRILKKNRARGVRMMQLQETVIGYVPRNRI